MKEKLWAYVQAHPIVSLFVVVVLSDCLVEIIKALRGRCS